MRLLLPISANNRRPIFIPIWVFEILRAQKKYSKTELQQTNGQCTYIVLAQNVWPQKRYSW